MSSVLAKIGQMYKSVSLHFVQQVENASKNANRQTAFPQPAGIIQ